MKERIWKSIVTVLAVMTIVVSGVVIGNSEAWAEPSSTYECNINNMQATDDCHFVMKAGEVLETSTSAGYGTKVYKVSMSNDSAFVDTKMNLQVYQGAAQDSTQNVTVSGGGICIVTDVRQREADSNFITFENGNSNRTMEVIITDVETNPSAGATSWEC